MAACIFLAVDEEEVTFVYDEVTVRLDSLPCRGSRTLHRYRHHCFLTPPGLLPTFASWPHVSYLLRLQEVP
jgi:hypothetical protein